MYLRKLGKKAHFVAEEPITWILYLAILIAASIAIVMVIKRAVG